MPSFPTPKVWLVARHEYSRMVRRRSFLVATLGVPLLLGVVMGISIYFAIRSQDNRPVGYVDESGVLAAGLTAPVDRGETPIEMRAYPDRNSAQVALERGEIQAFYLLPADYRTSQQVVLHYWSELPGRSAQEQFDDLLRANLLAALPDDLRTRAIQGPDFLTRSADGSREIGRGNFVPFLLPIVAGFLFSMVILYTAGYMLQAVTTEKENRTMEVMITSLPPQSLIAGKAVGLMGVGLSQLAIWALTAVVALLVGAPFLPALQGIRVPWALLGLVALYFLPAYALSGGIMTAIGSAVTDTQQGQQVSGIVNLLFALPFFFVALIIAVPDSPALVALTLFPTSAFLTIMMRWSMGTVPFWQLICSWVLQVIAAGFSIWAAARILRLGMLRYGQRLSLRDALQALRIREATAGEPHA